MSIIKCSECQKDISDEAISCPFCGKPNKIKTITTIQLTSKKWKIWKLISVVLIIVGFISLGKGSKELGTALLFIGFLSFIVSKFGSWWTNR